MTKREIFSLVALVISLFTVLTFTWYIFFVPYTIRIGIAPLGGEQAQFLSAFANALKRENANIRLTIVPFITHENVVAAMNSGKVDMAVVRADVGLPNSALAVAILHQNVTTIFARPGSKIQKIEDLKHRTVVVLARGSANVNLFEKLLSLHGLTAGDLRMINASSPEALKEIGNRETIDAVFIAGPRGEAGQLAAYGAFEELLGEAPKLVPLGELAALLGNNSALAKGEILIGEFGNKPPVPAKAIPTLTFPELIVAHRKLSANAVRDFTEQLFNLRHAISVQFPIGGQIAPLVTDRGSQFAVHPGAEVYYDASEVPFLERYSDFLWFGFFGIGGVTSAVTWLLSRALPKRRELILKERSEVVRLLDTARRAHTLEEVTELEEKVDKLVVAVADQIFNGVLDLEQQAPAFEMLFARVAVVLNEKRSLLELKKEHDELTERIRDKSAHISP